MIKTITPSSPILKKYIACFYTYEGEPDSSFSYFAFPHYNVGLSFFINASIERNKWSVEISGNSKNNIHIEVLGKYTRPVFLSYKGSLKEISIVFKPLGLNRFIRNNYNAIAPSFSQELSIEKWKEFGKGLFSFEHTISNLESFLLSQFAENQEVALLESSLQLLENNSSPISISSIADSVGLHVKTYQRYFKKHMGCSPIEYRRICRFRNSLDLKLNSAEMKNLTEISHEEGFYDQAYLIKEFRKLTNHNPKEFFRSTSRVDGDSIIWEIK